jgi:hypothetical protein
MELKRSIELIPEIGIGVCRYRGDDEPLQSAVESRGIASLRRFSPETPCKLPGITQLISSGILAKAGLDRR